MILGTGGPNINEDIKSFVETNSGAYKSLILTHAERFIELASMIFDLQPFIPFINAQTKSEIVEALQAKVAAIEDPMRKSRATITLFKV
jgi:hypothetical protein